MASQTYVDSVTLTAAAEFNKFDTAAYAALSGVSGTNTIVATGPANLTLVATNPILWFLPANTNTGATTLNITPSGGAALGAKNLFVNGIACVGGEFVAGVPVPVVYDGTQYQALTANSRSILPFCGNASQTAGTTVYYASNYNSATEANVPYPVPFACVIRNLYCSSSTAPTGSDTFIYTLRKNGVDTALTATITGVATTASDLTHTVAFAAGDLITMKVVSSGGAATAFIKSSVGVNA